MSGDELILKYKTHFFNEFIKCCQLLTIDEQIHFADTLQKILPLIYQDENNPQIWTEIEQELYKKYRHKMRFFSKSGFMDLFFRNSESGRQLCNVNNSETNGITPEFYTELLLEMYSLLENIKTFLYLVEPRSNGLSKSSNEAENLLSAPLSVVKHKIFDTRPQQVLLMYYITKGLGIKAKIEIPITKIAMFYHALLGWEYNDINNTGMYKLLKKAPYIQANKKLLHKDLLWVKSQIELLGLTYVLELIDKELKELENYFKNDLSK